MNPELEGLLAALAARDNASPAQFAEADVEVERLLKPILERLSSTGRADFFARLADALSRLPESRSASAHFAAHCMI